MTIIQILASITVAVILSASITTEAVETRNQCKTSDECASWLGCINASCGNPCEFADQGGRARCEVTNHQAEFTCTHGHAFPSGSHIKLCLPVDWACEGDVKNPANLKCNTSSWICLESHGINRCGEKDKILQQAIQNILAV